MSDSLIHEISRRRTFAIISHPDAGKTTLTEKLLLYSGAIDIAGSVRAKKDQRHATSDWMELERQRGISITSTVLQFDYEDHVLNLLDTPGHEDFSEDTYRTLTAADNAVMLIDAAKGIEPQTRKLFEVCRMRGIPIFTFINKMDRPSREPLDLLDELEKVFGIRTYPINWPLGSGSTFRGVYDRRTGEMNLFDRTQHGATMAPVIVTTPDGPQCAELVDAGTHQRFLDEMDLLEHAGERFDGELLAQGKLTPVYFGSAVNNFGVKLFLDSFLRLGLSPGPRHTAEWTRPTRPAALHRVCLQNSSEHGPQAPRQRGVSSSVFRPLRKGYASPSFQTRHEDAPLTPAQAFRARKGHRGRSISRRHSRPGKPGAVRYRGFSERQRSCPV